MNINLFVINQQSAVHKQPAACMPVSLNVALAPTAQVSDLTSRACNDVHCNGQAGGDSCLHLQVGRVRAFLCITAVFSCGSESIMRVSYS